MVDLEAGKPESMMLASAEALLTISSDGRRQKVRTADARERQRARGAPFCNKPIFTIRNPLLQ
jgi:hypothetical protein